MLLQQINKFLKLAGYNLVHAKKVKVKIAKTVCPPYRVGKGENVIPRDCIPSPTCCVDEYNAKSDCRTYPARSAFTTADDGQTHYVGDDCPGGHAGEFIVGPVGAVGTTWP